MTPRDWALLAAEAYTAAPDIGRPDSASRAIVRHTPAGLVIAFRGSDDVDSWAHDLDAALTWVHGVGPVHLGFWRAWTAMMADTISTIGATPVTLVGHSLGAALAVCAAISLELAGRPPLAVWGFEPPRIGPTFAIAHFLSAVPIYLYRHGSDPVPDLPLGWQHAAPLTHIGAPAEIMPDIRDHYIERVIAALS